NDIAFANDSDWLDHEIEFFNQSYSRTHAKLIAWVRISNLSTLTNTTIYMYYGNTTMSSRQNPTGVWDNSYRGVWHLSELSGSARDSTSFNTSGTVGPTVNRGVTGEIDGAYDFSSNGITNFHDPSDGHLDMGTGSFTISFWMNIDDSNGGYQLPLYKGATTSFDDGYDFETDVDATRLGFRICKGSNLVESSSLSIDFDSWTYVTGVVNRTSNMIYLFKNGLQVDFGVSIASVGNIDNDLNLLASYAPSMEINGLLDEIRICNISRSADWILTEYNNQHTPESFLTFGIEIQVDTTPPTYSNLEESSDPLELGESEVITINVTDLSGILQVKIQCEGLNYSMINIEGDTWQYNTWMPNHIGNYTYIIYMEDNLSNWNSTIGTIEVLDITPPSYSNLDETSDPLELGQIESIQINVTDFSGISQVKIEFEGVNHSMTDIGDNIWQYNSWRPNNWIVYQYKIYIEDNNDNWKVITNNITVQDTIAPPQPFLNNPPSGDISGDVVFDWVDGSDPSGISYYILIIDNETDPYITPGYIKKYNITNLGNESSYFELTDDLPLGKYYYFLTQVDGAGHESSYTMGTFTINLNPNNNDLTIFIVITVIVISVASSITAITIVRKKSRKRISPPRKKVHLKIILAHIDKISPRESTPYQKVQIKSDREEL
ncbi:MAG: DUF2341 domain-containing protein, partial [Candidatus Thorarchaeota archaeon]